METSTRTRPIVLVTGPASGGLWMWLTSRFQVWLAGGKAIRLVPQSLLVQALPDFDALVLGGGSDIDPLRYGQEPLSGLENPGELDRPRDATELRVLDRAVRQGKPVLGTCRGVQLINIYFGGDLYQSIDEFYKDEKKYKTILPRKLVRLDPGSRFSEIVGTSRLKVNSLHSQALRQISNRFKVVALEKSGVVQAIESVQADENIIGVQWHPEFMFYKKDQRALFRWLVERAALRLSAD